MTSQHDSKIFNTSTLLTPVYSDSGMVKVSGQWTRSASHRIDWLEAARTGALIGWC